MVPSTSLLFFVSGIALLLFLSLVAYGITAYNSLVRLNRDVDRAWSNIDVLLKQRRDELPKLIDTAREYMEYEKGVLEEVTQARTRTERASTPREEAEADEQLRGALGNLLAVAEDYPELKADGSFQQLQGRISDIEDKIADRREYYNNAVNTYNIRINQVPYNLLAPSMGYADRELFEVDESERRDVDIANEFSS